MAKTAFLENRKIVKMQTVVCKMHFFANSCLQNAVFEAKKAKNNIIFAK